MRTQGSTTSATRKSRREKEIRHRYSNAFVFRFFKWSQVKSNVSIRSSMSLLEEYIDVELRTTI